VWQLGAFLSTVSTVFRASRIIRRAPSSKETVETVSGSPKYRITQQKLGANEKTPSRIPH
jgi:hypothetical protein